jgi:hypothetical protein
MSYNAKKDFIKRSLALLEQYDEFIRREDMAESTKYEETLFLNCLIGLLVIIDRDYRGPTRASGGYVIRLRDGRPYSLSEQNISKLRNRVVHSEIEFRDENQDGKIDAISIPEVGSFNLSDLKPIIKSFAEDVYRRIPD